MRRVFDHEVYSKLLVVAAEEKRQAEFAREFGWSSEKTPDITSIDLWSAQHDYLSRRLENCCDVTSELAKNMDRHLRLLEHLVPVYLLELCCFTLLRCTDVSLLSAITANRFGGYVGFGLRNE